MAKQVTKSYLEGCIRALENSTFNLRQSLKELTQLCLKLKSGAQLTEEENKFLDDMNFYYNHESRNCDCYTK